jgi:hypothetical protein
MRKRDVWMYADNFISNGVKGNYTRALAISSYHYRALYANRANPKINALLLTFTPIHKALISFSSAKKGALGTRKSDNVAKDRLFSSLTSTALPEWQRLIGNVYMKKTPQFLKLFPNGLTPFHRQSESNKLLLIATLLKKCQADASLSAVAALISTFYTKIKNACSVRGGDNTTVSFGISNQKQAIDAMCDAHFANHGIIISLFSKQPKMIKSFTDVETLQIKVHSAVYNNTVNANKIKKVAVKKVTADSKIIVTSNVDMMVWVNDKAKNKNHPEGVFIPAKTPTEATFPGLGNPKHRVFQVKNLNLITKGKFSVKFL